MKRILIDANLYLDFYRLPSMRSLLPLLEGVRDHIFVSHQIVIEVERNKLDEAASFLRRHFERASSLKLAEQVPFISLGVPDTLFDADSRASISAKVAELKKHLDRVRRIGEEIAEEVHTTIERTLRAISRSGRSVQSAHARWT